MPSISRLECDTENEKGGNRTISGEGAERDILVAGLFGLLLLRRHFDVLWIGDMVDGGRKKENQSVVGREDIVQS